MQVLITSQDNWQTSEHCWSRGCACIDGKVVRDADLHRRLSGIDTVEQARQFAERAGGFFSFIRILPNGDALAVVDLGRSIPLFFCKRDGQLLVSDSAHLLAEHLGPAEPDPLAKAEFMLICCVGCNDTLHPEIKQLRAGELLEWRNSGRSTEIQRYFRYRQRIDPDLSRSGLLERGEQALEQAAANLIEYAEGSPVAVPLSGGMDSTLLLATLKLLNCPRLQAFTYGQPQASEVRCSRQIAAELGVEWTHVPYSAELWRRWFYSADRTKYYAMADNLCSLPHIQDFPAVAELRQAGKLVDGTVVASGISIESFYGSPSQPPHPYQSETRGVDPRRLAEMIIGDKYKLWPELYADPRVKKGLASRILDSIGDLESHGHAASCYESWFTHEKMSKFYNNSVRVYEYWGLDWWLPLWDRPVIEYWQQVPAPLRRTRTFTAELVSRMYRRASGCEYRPLRYESNVQRGARLMRHAIQHLPFLRGFYQRMKRRLKYDTDPLGWFGLFDRELFQRLYHPKLSINSLLVREYFDELDSAPDADRQ